MKFSFHGMSKHEFHIMQLSESKVIDKVRFPLAVFVVIWHTSMSTTIDPASSIFFQRPSAFIYVLLSGSLSWVSVPTFFFISGYLFFSNLGKWNWSKYVSKLQKRAHSLLIPFLLWICIYLVYSTPWIIHSGVNQWFSDHGWLRVFWDSNRIGENIDNLYNIIGMPMHHSFPVLTPMWYLRDLMIICFFSPIVYWFVTRLKEYGLLIVAILTCLNIWIPIEGFSAIGFFFFTWGGYYRINNTSFVTIFKRYELLSYIIVLFSVLLSLYYYTNNRLISEIFIKVYTVFGVIAVFNIANYAKTKVGNNNIYSESSFFIYCSHIMMMGLWSILFSYIWQPQSELAVILHYFLIITLTISSCILLYIIMSKRLPKLIKVLMGGR